MINIENQVGYPLEQCATCDHEKVCKWIEVLDELQNATPINFTHATCIEYEDKTESMDTISDEEVSSSMYSDIIELVERYMTMTGTEPSLLTMNKATKDMFVEEVLGNMDVESDDMSDMEISYVIMGGATLYIKINNAMPDRECVVSGGKAGVEEDE